MCLFLEFILRLWEEEPQLGVVSLPPHAIIYGKAVDQFLGRLNMVTVSL